MRPTCLQNYIFAYADFHWEWMEAFSRFYSSPEMLPFERLPPNTVIIFHTCTCCEIVGVPSGRGAHDEANKPPGSYFYVFRFAFRLTGSNQTYLQSSTMHLNIGLLVSKRIWTYCVFFARGFSTQYDCYTTTMENIRNTIERPFIVKHKSWQQIQITNKKSTFDNKGLCIIYWIVSFP